MDPIKYKVIRYHIGDKIYSVGDTRLAVPQDVAHLIGNCLVEIKAIDAIKNKALKTLKNKAAK